jgi:hypothetical protein
MNRWVEASIKLASSPGYLDRLTEIYPSVPSERPELPSSTKKRIEELQGMGKHTELISLLVQLRSHPFPFEHPYVSLLRAKPDLIKLNPVVVADIGSMLRKLGAEGIIEGCERPPDLNRQMGHSFQSWLKRCFPTKGYKFLDEYSFGTYDGNCFLSGGDKRLTAYANRYLGCELPRNRDMLAKVKGRYIIAEARFLSSGGGSQSRDVRETIGFVKDRTGNATRIAVLDGMTWFDDDMLHVIKSLDDGEVGLSALLLEDYFDSLR